MRLAVTGAAGLTGAEIVTILIKRGHHVRAIVRRETAHTPPGSERVVADCSQPDQLADALDGCDVLVHAAGITLGPEVARALRRSRTRRVVVVSSAGVYSTHRSASRGYLEGEREIFAAAPEVCVVRPTMIYGSDRDRNVHHVIRFARRWRFLPQVGSGRARLQPIHFEDAAAVVAALADVSATGVVDAGAKVDISLRDALAAVFDALGLPVRIVPISAAFGRGTARIAEAVLRRRGAVERIERMLEDRTVNVARMVALTGLEPRDFRRGVRDQVERLAR